MEMSIVPRAGQSLVRPPQAGPLARPTMLSPDHAMQLLDARLGITVGKSTFYRWILAGRFFSIRLGGKIYIPLSEMEIAMERLRRGEKL
jgi:hypothetical protein